MFHRDQKYYLFCPRMFPRVTSKPFLKARCNIFEHTEPSHNPKFDLPNLPAYLPHRPFQRPIIKVMLSSMPAGQAWDQCNDPRFKMKPPKKLSRTKPNYKPEMTAEDFEALPRR
jgi:hypothetical protein